MSAPPPSPHHHPRTPLHTVTLNDLRTPRPLASARPSSMFLHGYFPVYCFLNVKKPTNSIGLACLGLLGLRLWSEVRLAIWLVKCFMRKCARGRPGGEIASHIERSVTTGHTAVVLSMLHDAATSAAAEISQQTTAR